MHEACRFLTALFLSGIFGQATSAAQRPCESLAGLAVSSTKITLAQSVPQGAFTPPPSPAPPMGPPTSYKGVPEFCRVVAELTPTADSVIKIEVWMPTAGWNGKYRGQGNGGFAGTIDYPGLGAAVKRGYATAGTDTGHSGSAVDAAWALGHPEKVVDFGYRAIHEMTLKAKAIVEAFYSHNAQHSYFASCSDGGREALMEAQRFPEDYDGIVAGAFAGIDWTALMFGELWTGVNSSVKGPDYDLPQTQLDLLTNAVVAQCGRQDGGVASDPFLNDPRDCHFDSSTLQCKLGQDPSTCLTAIQLPAVQAI